MSKKFSTANYGCSILYGKHCAERLLSLKRNAKTEVSLKLLKLPKMLPRFLEIMMRQEVPQI